MKGVFSTRIDPTYDDQPEQRYHFPQTYLRQVERTVGDLIVYYEPSRTGGGSSRRDGRQCYFAVAKVDAITPDPSRSGHFYALIDTATYLDFDVPVPFKMNDRPFERQLQKEDGSTNKGAFGRAVRNIEEDEFEGILSAGFERHSFDFVPDTPVPANVPGFGEEEALFARAHIEVTTNRLFRDRAFSRQVRQAYDRTCAFTGLKILNGMGRPEAQAAHIKPVCEHGPDTVRNGIALSSTIHWLFDRGLISVDDNFKILRSAKSIPENLSALLNRDGYIRVPGDNRLLPNRTYLRHHREHIFKG